MEIIKTSYPDGSFYTTIDFSKENISAYKDLTFRINSYDDLWQLRQIKDICDHNKIKVNLNLPNLFCAQEDRRFNSNESSGLKLVCQFINDMKWESVKVFHPHNSELVEGLIDNVKIVDNFGYIGRILSEYFNDGKGIGGDYQKNITLFSTDGGSYKWINKLADKIGWEGEVYGASKSRKYEDGKSKLTQQIDRQDFEGKDILITDDICVNGGTFIGLAKMLRERNCGKLYLAVSHLTVENPNPELFKVFDRVFTTNSKGYDYKVIGSGHDKLGYIPENLEVINLF